MESVSPLLPTTVYKIGLSEFRRAKTISVDWHSFLKQAIGLGLDQNLKKVTTLRFGVSVACEVSAVAARDSDQL